MKTNNNPRSQLLLICTRHGQQTAINRKGLETEHLILGCGCAYQLTDYYGPLYDGNTNEQPDFFEVSREAFVFFNGLVPADEYFRRLAAIRIASTQVLECEPLDGATQDLDSMPLQAIFNKI